YVLQYVVSTQFGQLQMQQNSTCDHGASVFTAIHSVDCLLKQFDRPLAICCHEQRILDSSFLQGKLHEERVVLIIFDEHDSARHKLFWLLQFDPKGAALSGLRFHAQFAFHSLYGLAHDAQANPGPVVFRVVVDAFEHSKNALLLRRVDADAVVREINSDPITLVLRPNADARHHTSRNKFHRIADEIGAALREER